MKNFFDCKDEKITEKAFSQSLIISVVSILLCLVALCSMTYAWFTTETSSAGNTLMSGSFDVTIEITKTDGEATTASEAVILENGKYTLTDVGTYTVTLTPTEESTVKGYCVIKVGNTEYCTSAIVNEKTTSEEYSPPNAPFTFKIETTEANTEVEFEIKWGAPAEDANLVEDQVIEVETVKSEKTDTSALGNMNTRITIEIVNHTFY